MSKDLVKDRVVEYLIEELNVPENRIELDTALDEYEEGVEGYIDITVVHEDEDGCLVPLMVVQCLDEDIEMTQDVVEAQMDMLETIDNATQVGRIILTNGDQMMYADWTGQELTEEEALPSYEKMLEEYKQAEEEYLEFHEHDHEHGEGCGCDHHHHEHGEGCGEHHHEHGCCGEKKEDGHGCCGEGKNGNGCCNK